MISSFQISEQNKMAKIKLSRVSNEEEEGESFVLEVQMSYIFNFGPVNVTAELSFSICT